ncbi:G protein-like protein-coupled receptor : PQ-loop [Stipitochalara longipes BDJ]|nr:G protein-like protein-coupled receptor : PQ-loop [Stipitochalara longipes BDJ]
MDVPIAADILGTLGAVCWSIQLIPQIIINYRRHNTIGLQRSMMLLWACAGVPLGAYNITGHFNIALQVQPQILTVLSLITWIQCYHYDDKWSISKCCVVVGVIGALFGGIEAGLVFALKAGLKEGRHWPVTLMGVFSTVLLSAGVLRHYYDIYIHRTVRGISFIFVAIDAAGDVFSLISVFFQPKLDILGMVIYATEFVLWCGVFACGGYFDLMPWIRQKARTRKRGREREASDVVVRDLGVSNDVSLQRVPSSTSVFRTPSSIVGDGISTRSRTID